MVERFVRRPLNDLKAVTALPAPFVRTRRLILIDRHGKPLWEMKFSQNSRLVKNPCLKAELYLRRPCSMRRQPGVRFFLKSPGGKTDRIKDRKIKKRCKV